jgi:hypothetical protein
MLTNPLFFWRADSVKTSQLSFFTRCFPNFFFSNLFCTITVHISCFQLVECAVSSTVPVVEIVALGVTFSTFQWYIPLEKSTSVGRMK